MKFAYNQLDWLIPYYVDDYIELTDNQDSYIEKEVEGLLTWHCASHLGAYADLLRNANEDFQQGIMDEVRLQQTLTKIESYWKEIIQRASPAIAQFFLTANNAQLDEFFAELQEKNSEWLEEYNSKTEAQLLQEYQGQMTAELERWFGSLTVLQQQAVVVWSQRFKPFGMEGLKARERWQENLRILLSQRDDRQAYVTGIETLFENPGRLRSPRYLSMMEHNRRTTIELVAYVGTQLSAEQRKHLEKEVSSMAEDFDQLACTDEPPSAPAFKFSHPDEVLLGPF